MEKKQKVMKNKQGQVRFQMLQTDSWKHYEEEHGKMQTMLCREWKEEFVNCLHLSEFVEDKQEM